ncbi:rad51 family dna repair protein [Diplodia corticola]|uniref:Rad51 family dna repair protein n=1 Tax=Diplodia corticola TaxID=236234 RepID=A0A1J9R0J1_9PEZI|nr:rad51 family dna repair protein [Diplodia corticola]OJD34113.1 rad51 family dna repair protein [Diplodia corticola]
MAAQVLGRRLLGEVEEARLDEVFNSVRLFTHPEPSEARFGIPPLDRLLRLFEQSHSRYHDPGSPPLDQAQRHRPTPTPPLIELTSAGPGAGKTQLLYLITALAILPRAYASIDLQGKASAIVVVDTDGHFSVSRLATVAKGHIARCCRRHAQQQQQQRRHHDGIEPDNNDDGDDDNRHPLIKPAAVDSIIAAALTHVHILQPQSQAALLDALRALPTYLFSRSTTSTTTYHHSSAHRPLHSILLDSASAFFWPLRAAEDDARLANATTTTTTTTTTTPTPPPTTASSYTALARTLLTLRTQLNCAIVATTVASSSSAPPHSRHHVDPSSYSSNLKPLLPATWPATFAPSLRLGVGRAAVRGFAPAMSVAEARRERGLRQGVVERGRCGVWVEGSSATADQLVRGYVCSGPIMGAEGWVVDVRGDGVVVVVGEEEEGGGGGSGGEGGEGEREAEAEAEGEI